MLYMPMFWDTFRENWSSGNFLSKSPMDFFDQFFLNMTFLSVFAEKCCICLCFEVDFEKISLGLYFYRNRRSTSSIFFFRNKFLSMFAGKRRICGDNMPMFWDWFRDNWSRMICWSKSLMHFFDPISLQT